MAKFYDIDSSRVTLREYSWGTSWILLPLIWLLKLLRIRLPATSDDPPVDSLTSFRVSDREFPPEVKVRFEPYLDELASLGFHSPVYHLIDDQKHSTRFYWVTCLHSTSQSVARLHYRIWTGMKPPKENFVPVFLSGFQDNSFLVTTSGKPDMLVPSSIRMVRLVGATMSALWDHHRRALSQESFRNPSKRVASETELLEFVEQHHGLLRDFHLQRNVFQQAPAAEDTFVMTSTGVEVQASGMPNADVLVELDRLQKKRTSWISTLLVFIVSLAVFMAVGFQGNGWGFLLLLIVVLFFHESGHFLAMKWFKYRDVRMFFIPFLGAAVIGRHYNVAGWKKAIVSLMGPLPGIVLGIVLGIIAMAAGQPKLFPASLILIGLNGFQLIPVLPLDGGQLLHTTLFCRHPLLDVGFRLLAALALIVLGLFIPGYITIYIGVALLLSLPVAFRTAKIANRLRMRGVPAASADAQTIPLETAQLIIGEVRSEMPAGLNARLIAQHTINIFETLNARPPHWVATLALWGVHGMSLMVAIVFMTMFVIAQQGNFGDFVRAAARQPQHTYTCGETMEWRGAKTSADWVGERNAVIATFTRRGEAEIAYGDVIEVLPATATARLFGSSLIISFPAEEPEHVPEWQQKMAARAETVVVSSRDQPAMLSLMAIAPTAEEASAIEMETDTYLVAMPDMYLLPPWLPTDTRPEVDRARHAKARETLNRLGQVNQLIYEDPLYKASSRRVAGSMMKAEENEVKQLAEGHRQLLRQIRQKHFQKFRQDHAASLDMEVVDKYEQIVSREQNGEEGQEPDPQWIQLGARLGQLPLEGNRPRPGAARYSAVSGSVSRHGLVIQIDFVTFEQIEAGAPALAEWLCQRKCAFLKYDFASDFR